MLKNFECVRCGNCCRKNSFEDGKIIANKPCKYLDENNLCMIYETKPEVCNDFPLTLIDALSCKCKGKLGNKISVTS